ncbi:MAG: hypothetical protein PHT12_00920 [Patescibacteria group bacterium]|nr:hypothetical protein [Patescibacteria group bacterium]
MDKPYVLAAKDGLMIDGQVGGVLLRDEPTTLARYLRESRQLFHERLDELMTMNRKMSGEEEQELRSMLDIMIEVRRHVD